MRPLPVVVVDVLRRARCSWPPSENQQPVKALGAEGPYEALGVGVRVGSLADPVGRETVFGAGKVATMSLLSDNSKRLMTAAKGGSLDPVVGPGFDQGGSSDGSLGRKLPPAKRRQSSPGSAGLAVPVERMATGHPSSARRLRRRRPRRIGTAPNQESSLAAASSAAELSGARICASAHAAALRVR
jgi:hypothetical protein